MISQVQLGCVSKCCLDTRECANIFIQVVPPRGNRFRLERSPVVLNRSIGSNSSSYDFVRRRFKGDCQTIYVYTRRDVPFRQTMATHQILDVIEIDG